MPPNKGFDGNANNRSLVEALPVKVLLDHHYPKALVQALRESGIDAVSASEVGMQLASDEEILEYCRGEERVVLTNNHSDFAQIARNWIIVGRSHCGIVYTSDQSLPRTVANAHQIVRRINMLIATIPSRSNLQDQQRWL